MINPTFAYSDDVALDVMWEFLQKTIMENIQLKAQLKTAEETVQRLMPPELSDSDDFD